MPRKKATLQVDAGDHTDSEVIDLNVSDLAPPAFRVPTQARPTNSLRSVDSTESQAPKSAALDIAYFFSSKTAGVKTRHCIVCK